MFWRGKRAELELDRGPWRDQSAYLRSVGQREIKWTSRFGKPQRNEFPHNDMLKGEIAPELHIELLNKYLSLAPYLLPRSRENSLNQPTLRHADLNPTNVFVSETGEISCIIDWQHTTILPLLLTAGNPPLFENPDSTPPKDFTKPSLPGDYESLSPEEKAQADELHRRRMLFYLYMIFNGKDNKPHYNALRAPLLMQRQHLVERAGMQWSGNTVTLEGALRRVVDGWDLLVAGQFDGTKCPVRFESDKTEAFYELEEFWFKANILVEHWREEVLEGMSGDGWVRSEVYDDVVEKNQELKKEWAAEAVDDEDRICVEDFWPFQDREERE